MKTTKHISKFVHYYLNDKNFSSLICKVSNDEMTCCNFRRQMQTSYQDVPISCWEILDFIAGTKQFKQNSVDYESQQSKFNAAGLKLFTQK